MRIHLSDLWTWRGTIDRGAFLVWGIILGALKYNLDRLLVWQWSGRRWSLLDYSRAGEYLWPKLPSADVGQWATMLAISLPFMAAGVVLTVKRLRAAKLSPWLVLLFFVPIIKLLFFALLSIIPSREASTGDAPLRPERWPGLFIPRSSTGAAAAGIAFATACTAVNVWLGTTLLRDYGWSLFVGLPFAQAFLAVLVYGYHEERTFRQCALVSLASLAAAGLALLLVAMEGVICLLMAVPLATPMALIGGGLAYSLHRGKLWRAARNQSFCLAVLIPALMLVEHAQPPAARMFSVTTSVIVDAPPERVWRNVVSFAELPPPREWLFRAGIAYPIRARIHGSGPGAVRHCEFSTGPFVEPIEIWDEPRLLKFSVTKNPPPMQEWTPYEDLRPAHLDGFLQSHAGQFKLTPLPNGRTRLEGTTWYYHHMWPATYWRWWSDHIIQTIHLRVLRHVKQLSESA
jgi:hypothetical protein